MPTRLSHTPRPLLLAVVCLALLQGCGHDPTATPPNLLVIVTDDQRFDMMGNVSPFLQTPEMDRLAAEGVRFDQAFVTTSICAASRASMLTGLVERTHRFTFLTPPLSRTHTAHSYPTLLKQAGYRSDFVGKFGVVAASGATEEMFDVFEELHRNPYFKAQPDGSTRHLTDITADRAIAFLNGHPADRPFALTVSFNAPHAEDSDARQYLWPPWADSLYTNVTLPAVPLTDPAFHAALPPFLRDPDINMNRYRWYWRFDTPEKAEEMRRGYYRMISGVDHAIGRIRESVEQLGMADNTVILLIGDNGYFLGERGYAGKWLPHEPSIRIPFLLYDPRRTGWAGLRPEAFVLNIDLAPTLLDLAQVAAPASMQGESVLPLLSDALPAGWRDEIWLEHLMEHQQLVKFEGVRTARYKYARYFEQAPVYETLYDLEADPLETRNLAPEADWQDVLDEMRSRCDTLRDGYGGPFRPHEAQEPAMRP